LAEVKAYMCLLCRRPCSGSRHQRGRGILSALSFCPRADSVRAAEPLDCENEGCSMPIVNRVAAMHQEITAWRRDLHAHPEIGFEVHRTATLVADKLNAFGCAAVIPGIGKTGVVGLIKGRKTESRMMWCLRPGM